MTINTNSETFMKYYRERKSAVDHRERMAITDRYMEIMGASRLELVEAYDRHQKNKDKPLQTLISVIGFLFVALMIFGMATCILDYNKSPSKEAIKNACQSEADAAVYKAARLGVTDQGLLRDMHAKIMSNCTDR